MMPFLIFYIFLWGFNIFTPLYALNPKGRHVTYGSSIVINQVSTGYKLNSSKVSFSTGSDSWIVTAIPGNDTEATGSSILWLIKSANEKKTQEALDITLKSGNSAIESQNAGSAVLCNDLIRLEHVGTHGTLQTYLKPSPLSGKREVGASPSPNLLFSEYKVICLSDESKFWRIGDQIRLYSRVSETYIQAIKTKKFDTRNCGRGCPILGHIEVSADTKTEENNNSWLWDSNNKSDSPSVWSAEVGLVIYDDTEGIDDDSSEGRDEL